MSQLSPLRWFTCSQRVHYAVNTQHQSRFNDGQMATGTHGLPTTLHYANVQQKRPMWGFLLVYSPKRLYCSLRESACTLFKGLVWQISGRALCQRPVSRRFVTKKTQQELNKWTKTWRTVSAAVQQCPSPFINLADWMTRWSSADGARTKRTCNLLFICIIPLNKHAWN